MLLFHFPELTFWEKHNANTLIKVNKILKEDKRRECKWCRNKTQGVIKNNLVTGLKHDTLWDFKSFELSNIKLCWKRKAYIRWILSSLTCPNLVSGIGLTLGTSTQYHLGKNFSKKLSLYLYHSRLQFNHFSWYTLYTCSQIKAYVKSARPGKNE